VVEAKDLNRNVLLKGSDYYHRFKVVYNTGRHEDVYDMTIPDVHNYYIASRNHLGTYVEILVHNCGESPLLTNESCNLASINLNEYTTDDQLRQDAESVTLLLNSIIDKNKLPFKELQQAMRATRKIGIGIMGFGDYCLKNDIVYGSNESMSELQRLLKVIKKSAHETSCNLDYPKIYKGRCNTTLLSIAPTGTISTLCSTTSGIEPPFGWIYERRILDGSVQLESNAIFMNRFLDLDQSIINKIRKDGCIADIDVFSDKEKKIFRVAFEISPEEHLNVQSSAQEIVDLGVSKTINLPESSTVEDVKNIYKSAWERGCKGITVYRNNSKSDQPISWELDTSCASGKCVL
jgi:ribonucleoside-diphosphate reductase alpha chain